VQFLTRAVSRWWTALVCIAIVAGAILFGGLGAFGLWEPHERQLADKAGHVDAKPAAAPAPAPAKPDECPKQAPKDATARSLQARAIDAGKDVSDSDAGRRLPFAILGLLTVLATAGITMRLAGPRAGAIAGLVLLSMPILVLQSRQLDSEIGTAAGGTLAIYGLLALGSFGDLARALPLGLSPPRRGPLVAAIDVVVGLVALVVGLELGFMSGGGLLGVLAPVGAFAVAGALGVPTIADGVRFVHNAVLAFAARIGARWSIGRRWWPYRRHDNATALLATAIAAIVIVALVYQIFALRDPQPGLTPPQREVLGHAIVAPGCWSPALGGAWRADDDLRVIYDSAFEQVAYGTFPWGLLAPIAFVWLLGTDDRRRRLGTLTVAWASAAWIASELFERKVGFTLYAGFPALAVALGAWLDGMLDRHSALPAGSAARSGEAGPFDRGRDDRDDRRVPSGALLVGAFALLATVDVAKDLQSFTEKLTSLLVGGDSIAYPTQSELLFLPTRLWLLVLGALLALAFAVALAFAGSRTRYKRLAARIGTAVAIATTLALSLFWAFGWQRALSINLSSKTMFDTVQELAKPGDQVVIMGDLGDAPKDYAPDVKAETAAGRAQIVSALERPNRVFAIAPDSEKCAIHREIGAKPYYVLDNRNVRSVLMSNKLDGATDVNPLRTRIQHAEPPNIQTRPNARIVWDNKIELIGWNIPKTVSKSSKFDVTMYYKITGTIAGSWSVLFHFDGQYGRAFNGDHPPIDNLCATSMWQAGDYIVDTYTVIAGNPMTPKGPLEVWTGFFTGSGGNFKNMQLTDAPHDIRDQTDRVKITTIVLD
jgi:hypothetical protein